MSFKTSPLLEAPLNNSLQSQMPRKSCPSSHFTAQHPAQHTHRRSYLAFYLRAPSWLLQDSSNAMRRRLWMRWSTACVGRTASALLFPRRAAAVALRQRGGRVVVPPRRVARGTPVPARGSSCLRYHAKGADSMWVRWQTKPSIVILGRKLSA